MEYSAEVAEMFCDGLRSGLSIRKIEKLEGMPKIGDVYQWLKTNETFAKLYASARDDQAETLADDILNIADDESIEPEHKRIMVDSRKWIAAKLKPKKYGDRQIVDQNVTVSLVDLVTASMKTVEQLPAPLPVTIEHAALVAVTLPAPPAVATQEENIDANKA